MIEEIERALEVYFKKWQTAAANADVADFPANAVGWKVADETEYTEKYQLLRRHCDRIVETWMNGRWIAKMHLKDTSLPYGIKLVKLMQRRPGSDDAIGLDHIDFICPNMQAVEQKLQASTLKWSWETNDIVDDYRWLSVWFDNTEAKIKDYSVLDIVIKELQEIR